MSKYTHFTKLKHLISTTNKRANLNYFKATPLNLHIPITATRFDQLSLIQPLGLIKLVFGVHLVICVDWPHSTSSSALRKTAIPENHRLIWRRKKGNQGHSDPLDPSAEDDTAAIVLPRRAEPRPHKRLNTTATQAPRQVLLANRGSEPNGQGARGGWVEEESVRVLTMSLVWFLCIIFSIWRVC
jgi:hypothetical protein